MKKESQLTQELIGSFIEALVQDRETAQKLLRENPDLLESRWINDETMLHFLSVEGFADAVKFLVGAGANVNAVNEFGDTPLIDVAELGNSEIVEILLKHGANPNATSTNQVSVLHAGVRSGNAHLVELLLSAGAQHNEVSDTGEKIPYVFPSNPKKRAEILEVFKKHKVAA
jgi:uncharacterized protein